MFSRKIILLSVLIFIAAFSVQAQKTSDWTIGDYFKNLPEKYITASGDYAKPSAETVVFDEQNGYAVAHLNGVRQIEPDEPTYPIFEMALFKSQTKSPLLVVSNMKAIRSAPITKLFFCGESAINGRMLNVKFCRQ